MIDTLNYRPLDAAAIAALEHQGCTADNWAEVRFADHADVARVRHTTFSGTVCIGRLNGEFSLPGGMKRRSVIRTAVLHNVTVGDGAYICDVRGGIANYDIASGAFIENVDFLVCTLDTSFGIGTEVSVLNETGGREVPIYPCMSAHTAYITAMYRNRPKLTERINAMVAARKEKIIGTRGYVGKNAQICDCGKIRNVWIGDYARVLGASKLVNGYLSSSEADPVYVGRNIMADGFVLASGVHLEDGAVVHHCFLGQATWVSKLFSAHDSLFFANCNCENGEAAAVFGGPYTVTMHKSSLLIAGMFSFLNAGSGSNQSNHMYKLGPIHQGIVERGSKTTSDSYILWPAKIGAFSLVMGRHVNHPDTSALPFSYLIEGDKETFLVPGINLRSVGTIRDAQKWPKRDKRRDPRHLDCINFNLLSPYTVGKMYAGINLLNALEATAGRTAERYSYQAMTIEAKALRKGRKLYQMAVDKFMGNSVISRIGNTAPASIEELRARLAPDSGLGAGKWVDVCGLFAPKEAVDDICDRVANGAIANFEDLEAEWQRLHAKYYSLEWNWVAARIKKWYGKEICELTPDDVRLIIRRWQQSVSALDDMLLEDAAKEFSLRSQIGFGIDCPEHDANDDFASVRGYYLADPFVKMVERHKAEKCELALKTLQLLENL